MKFERQTLVPASVYQPNDPPCHTSTRPPRFENGTGSGTRTSGACPIFSGSKMGLAPEHGRPVPVPFSAVRKWDWLRNTDVRCLSHFQRFENGPGSGTRMSGACPIFSGSKMGLAPEHGCPVPVPFSAIRKWDWLRNTDVRCLSHFRYVPNIAKKQEPRNSIPDPKGNPSQRASLANAFQRSLGHQTWPSKRSIGRPGCGQWRLSCETGTLSPTTNTSFGPSGFEVFRSPVGISAGR
jgi:hypothetical protein